MKRLLIILLLLNLPLATAQLENPREVNSADLKFTTTGTLNLDGNVKYVYLKLYAYPKSDYSGTVSSIDTSPYAVLKTDEAQQYYYYTWEPIQVRDADSYKLKLNQTQLDYSLTAHISSRLVLPKLTREREFPVTTSTLLRPYMQATAKIDSSNADIKQLANNLASGETDAYKVAFKFAKYVNEIMTYDKDFLESTQKASWVLENKKGVCDEYSILFMALCRAVGLPVRYVSGVAFSNIDNEFIPHSWAEVYFPDYGWIPFDPTYNEYGWIDATHIRMQETADVDVSAIRYIWSVGDVEGEQPDIKVVMSNKELGLPNYLINKLWAEESKIGFGSYNIIWMELKNPTNHYIIPEISLIKTPQIIGTTNQQYILLKPNSSEVIHWIVKIPSDLNEAYSYTYSIESSTTFAAPKNVSFVAESGAKTLIMDDINKKLKTNVTEAPDVKPELKIDIHKPNRAYLGKQFEIKVTVTNYGNVAIPDLKICIEDECEQVYLGISEETTETFTLVRDVAGDNRVKLTVTGQGVDVFQEITIFVKKQTILDILLDWIDILFASEI